ncbi:MAG: hypothetical protein ACKVS8_05930 [Phycisphaerales bacterium]
MHATRVFIEIVPARIAMWVVRHGRVVASRQEPLAYANWADAWPGLLSDLQKPLAQWTAELGVAGRETEVVYASPSGNVNVVSCPQSAGEAGARHAAELAMVGPGATTQIVDTATLSIDAPTRTAALPRQHHVLGVSEAELTASAIAACVQGAGLRVARLLPMDAVSLVRAASRAGEAGGGGAPADPRPEPSVRVVVWISGASTIVLAASPGRVRFFRMLSLGSESLVDCFCRPLRSDATPTQPFTPDRGAARRLLELTGIPTPETVVDAERGINGAAVLPGLQPVLQRYAVELKQTIRFGIPENERDGLELCFVGPGGALPRLAEVITQLSGFRPEQIAAVGDTEAHVAQDPGAMLAQTLARCDLNLLPADVARERVLRRVRRGMWAGIGSAAALIAMYAGSAALTLRSESLRAQGLARSAAALEKERMVFRQASDARAAVADLRARMAARMGEKYPLSHALAAIAENTPEGVTLASIDFTTSDTGRVSCALVGVTEATGSADVATVLTSYAQQLASVPILRNVRLGGTQRHRVGTTDVNRFEVSMELVGLPPGASPAGAGTHANALEVHP